MGVAGTSLRILWPRGRAHRLAGDGEKLLSSLGSIFDDLRDAGASVVDESRPGTATVTLPEWHETLGTAYDQTRPIAEQRIKLEAIRTSTGGMTLAQLQAQIQKELPGIIVSELPISSELGVAEFGLAEFDAEYGDYSPIIYYVSGDLAGEYEEARLRAILSHFAPLHLIPDTSGVTILGLTATAEMGAAIFGVAEFASDGTP